MLANEAPRHYWPQAYEGCGPLRPGVRRAERRARPANFSGAKTPFVEKALFPAGALRVALAPSQEAKPQALEARPAAQQPWTPPLTTPVGVSAGRVPQAAAVA
jgi:hypothetical protein